jgi:DNA invertase Pin-like site-specific DNA recombinase
MLIGYVRVSKSDGTQTLEPQRDAMLAAGVDPARIYEDLASGRRDDRPGLAACLKAIQPGNTLVLWKLDRLGRDLRHLVNTVEDLRTRGVGLKVLAGAGAQIDTTTANGRLAFGIFAAFAEFERELIAERTMAGLAAARARGRMGGRPRKMDRATLMIAHCLQRLT